MPVVFSFSRSAAVLDGSAPLAGSRLQLYFTFGECGHLGAPQNVSAAQDGLQSCQLVFTPALGNVISFLDCEARSERWLIYNCYGVVTHTCNWSVLGFDPAAIVHAS